MILIGRLLSPFVRRVAISLSFLNLPFEQRAVGTMVERDRVLPFNPLGRVPALVLDDGEILIDSTAILDYIDELAGPDRALIPPSGPQRRHVLKLVSFGIGTLEKTVAAFYERTRRPAEFCYEPWVAQCGAQARAGLDALEEAAVEAAGGAQNRVAENRMAENWLAGDRLTQADITAVCALDFMRHALPALVDADAHRRLSALAERCHALPAFRGGPRSPT